MVSHLAEFRKYLGALASRDRYVRYLEDVSEVSGQSITPDTLRSDNDIERFAEKLSLQYSEKSVENYRSVMRRYVDRVEQLGL